MKSKIIFLISFFLIVLSGVEAHGLVTEKSEVVGNYQVKMEYDTLGEIKAGETTNFNFELLKDSSGESTPFERVFVQVSKKVGDYPLIFSSNLAGLKKGENWSAGATIYIPVKGDYLVKLNYYNDGKELVIKTFEISVTESVLDDKKSGFFSTPYFLILMLFLAISLSFLGWKKLT